MIIAKTLFIKLNVFILVFEANHTLAISLTSS